MDTERKVSIQHTVWKVFVWSVFSCIQSEYGDIRNISPYSVQMWENTNQNNSEYRHFLYSEKHSEDIQDVYPNVLFSFCVEEYMSW